MTILDDLIAHIISDIGNAAFKHLFKVTGSFIKKFARAIWEEIGEAVKEIGKLCGAAFFGYICFINANYIIKITENRERRRRI